jgi:hypothetical protein
MARRRTGRSHDELPDLSGAQAGRMPDWWADLSREEAEALRHRHEQAQRLVNRGFGTLPPGWLIGESTGGLFDEP